MFKSIRFNFYLVSAIAVFFLVWFLLLRIIFQQSNSDANIYWSAGYSLVLLLSGTFFTYLMVCDKEIEYAKLRTIIKFLGLGFAAQSVAQILFSYNSYIFETPLVYPANADIFYLLGGGFYTVTLLLLARLYWDKMKYFVSYLVFFGFLTLAFVLWLFNAYGFVFELSAQAFSDMAYAAFEGPGAVIAISLLFATRFFKDQDNRYGLILICVGVVLQFLCDMYFVNAARVGVWAIGSFGDAIFLFAYYPLVAGAVLFLRVPVAMQMLTLFLNIFLFTQFFLSFKTDRFVSSAATLVISLVISFVLLKKNNSDSLTKEASIRLAALEESNAKLLELDQQKTEFLNIAAHQLRTPVSIIRNYVAMMQDGDFGEVPDQIKEVHGHIYQSNQWLVRLADEFLNLSKLESGQLKYHLENADIAKAVDEVVAEIKPKAEQKGLILELIRPNEPIMAHVDIEKIKHATMNLVENAVKYTLEGSIVVKVEMAGGGVQVTVTDTGIGIPPDDLPNLFQKFRRGKNASQIEVNTSTGLGLYIARKFIEGHKGKIWAKSEGEGRGSQFGYILVEYKK